MTIVKNMTDVKMEKQKCALDTDYFYETYYKPVKIDKNIH